MNNLSKEWAISMAFSIALLLLFGLGLVWINIERVDMAYELNKIQHQIDEGETLTAKLEVERNTLITPARLREVSTEYGLGPARPGQIRRVNASGEVDAPAMVSMADPAKSTVRNPTEAAVAAKAKTKSKAEPKAESSKAGRKP